MAIGFGKGEKAIWILAPLKIKERDRASGEETGETRTLFRAVPVFDRAQVTAGEHATPLEPPVEPLSGDSHEHLLEPLERFAGSLGFTVSFETIDGPSRRLVRLRSGSGSSSTPISLRTRGCGF